jgi:phage/plasmid-associated DNA primase
MAELPGIARWALGGLADLRAQGFFTETEAGLRLQDQMIRDAAPIRVFVDESCVLDAEGWVESQVLFDAYLRWAEKANTYKLDRASFFRDLNTAYPGKIENLKKRIGGAQVQCKRGITVVGPR